MINKRITTFIKLLKKNQHYLPNWTQGNDKEKIQTEAHNREESQEAMQQFAKTDFVFTFNIKSC